MFRFRGFRRGTVESFRKPGFLRGKKPVRGNISRRTVKVNLNMYVHAQVDLYEVVRSIQNLE